MDQVIPDELGLLTKCEEPVITNLERGVKSISGGDWKNMDAVELGRKPTRPVELGRGLICPTI